MMTQNPKTIADKFTINMIPKIEGDPEYKSINKIMKLLYTNADTLPTPQEGGDHRHIGIIMKPTIYNSLSDMACIKPPSPGVYSTVPMNATSNYQDQLKLWHDKVRMIYNNMGMI